MQKEGCKWTGNFDVPADSSLQCAEILFISQFISTTDAINLSSCMCNFHCLWHCLYLIYIFVYLYQQVFYFSDYFQSECQIATTNTQQEWIQSSEVSLPTTQRLSTTDQTDEFLRTQLHNSSIAICMSLVVVLAIFVCVATLLLLGNKGTTSMPDFIFGFCVRLAQHKGKCSVGVVGLEKLGFEVLSSRGGWP